MQISFNPFYLTLYWFQPLYCLHCLCSVFYMFLSFVICNTVRALFQQPVHNVAQTMWSSSPADLLHVCTAAQSTNGLTAGEHRSVGVVINEYALNHITALIAPKQLFSEQHFLGQRLMPNQIPTIHFEQPHQNEPPLFVPPPI